MRDARADRSAAVGESAPCSGVIPEHWPTQANSHLTLETL
jgi:hypothetical protein